MTDTYTYSDAAKEYALGLKDGHDYCFEHHTLCTSARAFDAGVAHERATHSAGSKAAAWDKLADHPAFSRCVSDAVAEGKSLVDIMIRRLDDLVAVKDERATRKPRTITTAAELMALPVGSVVQDRDGDAWVKKVNGWRMTGCESEEPPVNVLQSPPLTLLVPASEPDPAPIRLTDPEDPRIRVGAQMQWMKPGFLVDGSVIQVAAIRQTLRQDSSQDLYLLAEAPAEPEPVTVEALAAVILAADGHAHDPDWAHKLGEAVMQRIQDSDKAARA